MNCFQLSLLFDHHHPRYLPLNLAYFLLLGPPSLHLRHRHLPPYLHPFLRYLLRHHHRNHLHVDSPIQGAKLETKFDGRELLLRIAALA
jgi:hypothetical protein